MMWARLNKLLDRVTSLSGDMRNVTQPPRSVQTLKFKEVNDYNKHQNNQNHQNNKQKNYVNLK